MDAIKPINKVAIVFYLIVTDNGTPVFFPIKPMIGYTDESNLVFTDAFTGRNYLHATKIAGLDEEECFALNGDIDDLIKSTNESTIESALRKFWAYFDGRAFIYGTAAECQNVDNLMYPLDDESFEKLFGYNLRDEQLTIKENNDLIDDYIRGTISEHEYTYFLEHHQFPCSEKCKIIEFKPKKDTEHIN